MDDHHGPLHEAETVREICIAIDENCFTGFFYGWRDVEFCRILMHYINIYEIAFVHGVPWRFAMWFTNDYSKLYVYYWFPSVLHLLPVD